MLNIRTGEQSAKDLNINIDEAPEHDELEQQRKQTLRQKKLSAFNNSIPRRYRSINRYSGEKWLLNATQAVIWGTYGTGKTWLGYELARELILSGEINTYTIERERSIYNYILANRDKLHDINDRYKKPDLLIIDEFGKSSNTDAAISQIYDIIDYRYDWQKRTILICNAADKDHLKRLLPAAIKDRYKGADYHLNGHSRREIFKKEN